MKIEYKIVEALRELLREAEQDADPYGDYSDGVVEGLKMAYNKALVIADGFE